MMFKLKSKSYEVEIQAIMALHGLLKHFLCIKIGENLLVNERRVFFFEDFVCY